MEVQSARIPLAKYNLNMYMHSCNQKIKKKQWVSSDFAKEIIVFTEGRKNMGARNRIHLVMVCINPTNCPKEGSNCSSLETGECGARASYIFTCPYRENNLTWNTLQSEDKTNMYIIWILGKWQSFMPQFYTNFIRNNGMQIPGADLESVIQ